jgi:hypothetical protein
MPINNPRVAETLHLIISGEKQSPITPKQAEELKDTYTNNHANSGYSDEEFKDLVLTPEELDRNIREIGEMNQEEGA